MGRDCAECGDWKDSDDYSRNQWFKGEGVSRCVDCVQGRRRPTGRHCAECGNCKDSDDYSRNQWLKGDGASRCVNCVHGRIYKCRECHREFNNENHWKMHLQVHRPRSVSCPVCGETRFKSGANAVQHVESGYCSGCCGPEEARKAIHDYVSRKKMMQPFLTDRLRLTNGSGGNDDEIPDFPYQCRECSRLFRQLSQLLQHQDQKHQKQVALLAR